MKTITISNVEYKIEYGFNSLCDTDLLDRVQDMASLFSEANATSDADVSAMGKIRDLFCLVRELIFVGFQMHNPVDTVQDVGVLLDAYKKEAPEGESRGLLDLFGMLGEELANEGFLADLMAKMGEAAKEVTQNRKARRAK